LHQTALHPGQIVLNLPLLSLCSPFMFESVMQEKTQSVSLKSDLKFRREIYRQDVEKMAEWLQDDEITEHLNESQNIHQKLEQISQQSSLPIFSHHFNKNGTFFVITRPGQGPIGFLRLASKDEGAEMVVVIGERSEWGKGYGYRAVKKGLRHAFFEWREDQVIAKIHDENERSKHVFRKAGFTHDKDLNSEEQFSITVDEYL